MRLLRSITVSSAVVALIAFALFAMVSASPSLTFADEPENVGGLFGDDDAGVGVDLGEFKIGGDFGGDDIAKADPEITFELVPIGADGQPTTNKSVKPGETVRFVIRTKFDRGAYASATNSDFAPAIIRVETAEGLKPVGQKFTPDRKPKEEFDPTVEETLRKFYGNVTWTQDYRVESSAEGAVQLKGEITWQVCTDGPNGTCQRMTDEFAVELAVTDTPPPAEVLYERTVRDLFNGEPLHTELRAEITPKDAKPGDTVTATVRLTPDDGWFLNAETQPEGSLYPATEITAVHQQGLKPTDPEGKFTSDRKYKTERPLEDVVINKYPAEVVFSRTFTVTEPNYGLILRADYQACSDQQCDLPQTTEIALGHVPQPAGEPPVTDLDPPPTVEPIELTPELLAGLNTATEAIGPVVRTHPVTATVRSDLGRGEKAKTEFTASLSEADAAVGETVRVMIDFKIDEGWHLNAPVQSAGAPGKPLVIEVIGLAGLEPLKTGAKFKPDHGHEVLRVAGTSLNIYEDRVKFSRAYRVTDPNYGIGLRIDYQTCDDKSCLPAKEEIVRLGTLPMGITPPTAAESTPYASSFPDLQDYDAAGEDKEASLPMYLLFAFLGGMILNIMPCVLPVVAIKALSFVQQAGEDRKRILQLNLAYTAGVILVFMILATLAWTAAKSWGALFQLTEFNVAMTCLVFAMGLSLLGLFEIPIPGLAGSGMGGGREGLPGAFLTGVLATLLATPCSGPFLGVTLGWSVTQPPQIIYLVWFTLGLGMAFPYLLFGLKPSLINWLPKPGSWMIWFKEFCGLVLMGTVVYLLSIVSDDWLLPTMILLVGIATWAWLVGRVFPHPTSTTGRIKTRLGAVAVLVAICTFGLSLTFADANRLNYEPFSEARLTEALENGQTVLVDFTADWCATCKAIEKGVLDTEEVKEYVDANNIVVLKADYTNEDPEIKAWLARFDSISVPLTAIFPANRPLKPIVIRDVYGQETLLASLETATTMSGDGELMLAGYRADNKPDADDTDPQGEGTKLPWQPFDETLLAEAREDGRPVLIDFTANWCINCKVIERNALNTAKTKAAVDRHNVLTLKADFENDNPEDRPELNRWLEKFDVPIIPLTLLYPRSGGDPIVIEGTYNQAEILDYLQQATESETASVP